MFSAFFPWLLSLFSKRVTAVMPISVVKPVNVVPFNVLTAPATTNKGKYMAKYGKDAAAETKTRIDRWLAEIRFEARSAGLNPSVVAAIISRETAGLDLYCQPPPAGKLGDNGFGHGPMQIDKRSFAAWCADWAAGKLKVRDGIHQGCFVLLQKIHSIAVLIPTLPDNQRLHAAIAAYNCGEGNVKKAFLAGQDLDLHTTGQNYSADVLLRSQYFVEQGYDL